MATIKTKPCFICGTDFQVWMWPMMEFFASCNFFSATSHWDLESLRALVFPTVLCFLSAVYTSKGFHWCIVNKPFKKSCILQSHISHLRQLTILLTPEWLNQTKHLPFLNYPDFPLKFLCYHILSPRTSNLLWCSPFSSRFLNHNQILSWLPQYIYPLIVFFWNLPVKINSSTSGQRK